MRNKHFIKRVNKVSPSRTRIFGFDRGLFLLTIFLTVVGIVSVADTSSPQALSVFSDPYYFAKQQIVWAGTGFLGLIVASFIPYTVWKKYAGIIFAVSLVLLIAVLIPGVGAKVLGARRWIDLGFFRLQPSEVVKLSLAIFFARLADGKYPYWVYLGVLGLIGGLIMLQPDLGTLIIIIGIGMIQLFAIGMPILYMGGTGILGIIVGLPLIMFSDYRRERLLTFFKASSDPLDSSYHIRQILIALGSGGLFGVGLGESRQKHLFLPETATDSVFAIIAEEIGFLGSIVIIFLLMFFVFKALRIASRAPDTFSVILATGIAAWIGGQMFLNIASMVALTPLTGIPLPFFSYGGSSLTMVLTSVGILLNISKYGEDKKHK